MPQIFLDCDGVLADFDRAARELLGMCPRRFEDKYGGKAFWKEIYDHGSFYRDLPLMADARVLVDGVRHLDPVVLTGAPRGEWSQQHKREWVAEHFPGVPVIVCRSADKRDHASPGDVIIDDWPQYRPRWLEMGGVWISHVSAERSLAELWSIYPELLDLETREVTEHPTTTEARRAYHARYGRQPGRWYKTEIPGTSRPVYEKADYGELYAVTWRVEDDERVRGAFGLSADT